MQSAPHLIADACVRQLHSADTKHSLSVGCAAVLETRPSQPQDHKSGTVCRPCDYVGCHTASSGSYWRQFYSDSETMTQCQLFLTAPNRTILTYLHLWHLWYCLFHWMCLGSSSSTMPCDICTALCLLCWFASHHCICLYWRKEWQCQNFPWSSSACDALTVVLICRAVHYIPLQQGLFRCCRPRPPSGTNDHPIRDSWYLGTKVLQESVWFLTESHKIMYWISFIRA